jgi:hypothetical protein
MINLLIDAGAKFNTTENIECFMILNPLITAHSKDIAFRDSSILLTQNELFICQMFTDWKDVKLIYSATRDGFSSLSFHSTCDAISNTLTIIKTTSNSVFGGFTSASWSSVDGYTYDANAFIFSLRRSGNPYKERFNVTLPEYAIYRNSYYGPTFGRSHDIYVADNSNTNYNSYSYFGYSYQLPKNINYGSVEAQSYLAGSYNWQTSEIEVYQVTPFESYFVTPLHNGCPIIIL